MSVDTIGRLARRGGVDERVGRSMEGRGSEAADRRADGYISRERERGHVQPLWGVSRD